MQSADLPAFSPPSVTAVLCTYNRCESLATALESLALLQVPASIRWEVVVVDNNSNDATADTVQRYVRQYPAIFRYAFERRPGKSFALNTGIAHARGDVIAFVDDDVTVEPDWLHNLTSALHDGTWAGAGGRILPPAGFVPPRWFSLAELGGILCAHFDLGSESCELNTSPYGTNMAFRREVFQKYGGFRTDLGPRPGSEIRNEDTEFAKRLFAGGERLRYEPTAVVYHSVPPKRLERSFYLSWWFDYGRARVREQEPAPKVFGVNRHYLNAAKTAGMRIPAKVLHWVFTFDRRKRFLRQCELWNMAGRVTEAHRQAKAGKGIANLQGSEPELPVSAPERSA